MNATIAPLSLPVLSLRVGRPQQLGSAAATTPLARPWTSAIHKTPNWNKGVGQPREPFRIYKMALAK